MILKKAEEIAESIRASLAPHCGRCEIAGSIRRKKSDVGDIEIVAIPKTIPGDLFGGNIARDPAFVDVVHQWPGLKGSPYGKYTQRWIKGEIKLDLFMAVPDNWGLIYAIRTGSALYSHHVLAEAWVKAGYHGNGGMLRLQDGTAVPVREERDLFDMIGVPWMEPEKRNL
jgi:DNA polymerase/3'-5' exonuclease PolX